MSSATSMPARAVSPDAMQNSTISTLSELIPEIMESSESSATARMHLPSLVHLIKRAAATNARPLITKVQTCTLDALAPSTLTVGERGPGVEHVAVRVRLRVRLARGRRSGRPRAAPPGSRRPPGPRRARHGDPTRPPPDRACRRRRSSRSTRSHFIRIIIGWVSGSPSRQLNSSTLRVARRVDHQPGVEHARVRDALGGHAAHRRARSPRA